MEELQRAIVVRSRLPRLRCWTLKNGSSSTFRPFLQDHHSERECVAWRLVSARQRETLHLSRSSQPFPDLLHEQAFWIQDFPSHSPSPSISKPRLDPTHTSYSLPFLDYLAHLRCSKPFLSPFLNYYFSSATPGVQLVETRLGRI